MLNIQVLKTVLLAGAASAVLSTAALAADAADGSAADEGAWDVAFGVTLTSDYIGRGMDLSGGPAVQPWAEFTYNIFYAGYWGSNIVGDWENDLSIGVRPELGPSSLDLGYTHYIFSAGGDQGGEAHISGEITPVDPVTIGAGYWHGVGLLQDQNYAEVNASLDLVENISASGAVGWVFGSASMPYTTWNVGLTWNPVEPLELDLRYHAGPTANKVVVSALSSSLRSLGIIK